MVIIFGLILLIIGFVLKIGLLWTLGIIVLLGAMGHAVGGRRHYF
jgi:hypothetical protein